MIDRRVTQQRNVLEGLLDSLDAVARIARWPDRQSIPSGLDANARQLPERLVAANRLAADATMGAPAAKRVMDEIRSAIKSLETAYGDYQSLTVATPDEQHQAAEQLESSIRQVRDNPRLWT